MTAKELKASILDLAVRGKLVPQDPNDEPASVLLEKIRAEKRKLVKAGKIKKEKNPSEIYIAADGKPYEKFADGSETCIEDEIPFELPKGWAWARLGVVATIIRGNGIKRDEIVPVGVPCIRYGELYTTYRTRIDTIVSHTTETVACKAKSIKQGDVLLTLTGENKEDIGMAAAYLGKDNAVIGGDVAALKDHHCDPLWLSYFLASPFAICQKAKMSNGDIIVHLSAQSVASIMIPLPPRAEQKRIVELIDDLMPLVSKYAQIGQELSEFDVVFSSSIKKSILQYAVEGKLVPQDPNDEPASALVEHIAEERKALVKAGKLKRDKNESVIFRGADRLAYETRNGETVCIEDELPFKIPETWAWVRLGSICSFVHRGKSPQYSPIKACPVIAQKCNQWSGFCIEKAQFIDPKTISKYAQEQFLQDNDLLWNSTGLGTLGRMAIYKTNLNPYKIAVADSHVTVIRVLKKFVDPRYVFSYLTGPSVQSIIEDKADGSTKQKELATSTVVNYLLPLPPLAEQKRIVEQIEKMLKASETLTK